MYMARDGAVDRKRQMMAFGEGAFQLQLHAEAAVKARVDDSARGAALDHLGPVRDPFGEKLRGRRAGAHARVDQVGLARARDAAFERDEAPVAAVTKVRSEGVVHAAKRR